MPAAAPSPARTPSSGIGPVAARSPTREDASKRPYLALISNTRHGIDRERARQPTNRVPPDYGNRTLVEPAGRAADRRLQVRVGGKPVGRCYLNRLRPAT
jgi:hypothetical protein